MNSREKGKRGELELAHELGRFGYKTRRGQQYSGITGEADVVGIPGLHIECKRVEQLNIQKALDQSERDARAGEVPVVMHRKNREPWKVTLSLRDFMKLWRSERIMCPHCKENTIVWDGNDILADRLHTEITQRFHCPNCGAEIKCKVTEDEERKL